MKYDEKLEAFAKHAGFRYGWENLESSARRMAEHAVHELEEQKAELTELRAIVARLREPVNITSWYAHEAFCESWDKACATRVRQPNQDDTFAALNTYRKRILGETE